MSECRWKILPCNSNLDGNILSWTIETGKFESLDPRVLLNIDMYITLTTPSSPYNAFPISSFSTVLPPPPPAAHNIIDDCGIINYPLLTIFKDFDFFIDGTLVNNSESGLFGYTSLIKALTEQSGNLDGSILESGLFKLDQNIVESTDIHNLSENYGLYFRSTPFKNTKVVRLSGFLDLIPSSEALYPLQLLQLYYEKTT